MFCSKTYQNNPRYYLKFENKTIMYILAQEYYFVQILRKHVFDNI